MLGSVPGAGDIMVNKTTGSPRLLYWQVDSLPPSHQGSPDSRNCNGRFSVTLVFGQKT